MAAITLDHVTKQFPDGALAVNDLNLDIQDGEFCILVGPSGCGKSTTLNMIAGLEDITRGDLRFDEERVNDLAPKDRDIAMVFQNYALYPHMSVRQNMGFALKLEKVPKEEINRKVEEAARVLDLTQHLDRKPANLSGGQRQRVAMGRAIVRRPKAFLMDEPLSNLDAKLRVQMRTEVSRIQKQVHTTTVYVTHDQTEAMTLGDRVAVLRLGRLQQYASPHELYEHPRNLFVAGFIGSPSMNFVEAELEDSKLRSPFGDIPISDELRQRLEGRDAPRTLVLGIRPEHFEDASLVKPENVHQGVVFDTNIDVIESLGSDVYAHFNLEKGRASSAELSELAADSGSSDTLAGGTHVVARLDAATKVKEEQVARLWFDASKIQLFDPQTGASVLGSTPVRTVASATSNPGPTSSPAPDTSSPTADTQPPRSRSRSIMSSFQSWVRTSRYRSPTTRK